MRCTGLYCCDLEILLNYFFLLGNVVVERWKNGAHVLVKMYARLVNKSRNTMLSINRNGYIIYVCSFTRASFVLCEWILELADKMCFYLRIFGKSDEEISTVYYTKRDLNWRSAHFIITPLSVNSKWWVIWVSTKFTAIVSNTFISKRKVKTRLSRYGDLKKIIQINYIRNSPHAKLFAAIVFSENVIMTGITLGKLRLLLSICFMIAHIRRLD